MSCAPWRTQSCSRRVTHAAFLDPFRNFLIGDVLAAGALQELVGLLLLQLDAAAALLTELFVALPQLEQSFAASQTLCDLLQQASPSEGKRNRDQCRVGVEMFALRRRRLVFSISHLALTSLRALFRESDTEG